LVGGVAGLQVEKENEAASLEITVPSRLREMVPGGMEPMVELKEVLRVSVLSCALKTALTLVETFRVETAGVTVRCPVLVAAEVSESPE
jgi:hypothetical protein